MFEKFTSNLKKGWAAVTGGSNKKKKPTTKKPSTTRQKVKTKQAADKNKQTKANKNLNARIKHTTKKDAPSFKKAVNLGLKALDIIDRPRNALVNAIDDSKRGENTFKEGFKEGWSGKERVDGGDLLKRTKFKENVTRGAEKLGISKKGAKNIGKGASAVTGFGIDVVTDPLNAVTFGGGSFAKGLVTGVGGTLTKEAAEKATKAAGRHMLRTQGKKVVTGGTAKKVLAKHQPTISTVNQKAFNKAIEDMVNHGSTNLHKATKEYKAAKNVYDDLATSVAKDKGVNIQKMANRQTGRGLGVTLPIAGDVGVSANKMRDLGAWINQKTVGKTPLKHLRDLQNETFIRGFKPGMDVNDLTLTRLIDQNQRGLQEKLLSDRVDKIKKISKKTNYQGDLNIAKVLDTGKLLDKETGKSVKLGAKDAAALKEYQTLLDDIADQEVAHNLLDKKRDTYLPHVKSLKHETAAPWRKAATLDLANIKSAMGSYGKTYNPYANARQLDTSVTKANEIIQNEHGVKNYFETSAAKALAQRSVNSAKNIANKTAVDDVLENFGELVGGKDLVDHLAKRGPKSATHVAVVPKQQIAGMVIDPNSGTTIANILEQVSGLADKERITKKAALQTVLKGLPAKQYPVKELETVLGKLETNEELLDLVSNPGLAEDLHVLQQVYGTGSSTYLVPKNVVENFVKAPKSNTSLQRGLDAAGNAADTFNNIWKPLKTKYSAGYHVRNSIGGNVSMATDIGAKAIDPFVAMKSATVLFGKDNTVLSLGGSRYTVGELRDYLAANNILASTYHRGDLDTISKQLNRALSLNDFNVVGKLTDLLGNSIESELRTRHFVGALDKGMDPLTAAATVRKYQIDYQDLTDFEKGVMRRLQAFYTFSSKNLPLQITNLLDKPSSTLENAYRLSDATAEEYGVDPTHVPDYMANQLPMWFGTDQYGQPMNANLSLPQAEPLGWLPSVKDGWLPKTTQDWLTPGSQLVDKQNPLLKAGIELSKGINLFTGEKLEGDEATLTGYGLNLFNPAAFLKYGDEERMAGKTRQPHVQTAGITSSYDKDAAEIQTLKARNEELGAFRDALAKSLGHPVPNIYNVRKSMGYKARNENTPLDRYAWGQEANGLNITPVQQVSNTALQQYKKDKSQGKILTQKGGETYELQVLRNIIDKLMNRG